MDKELTPHFPTVPSPIICIGENKKDDSNEPRHWKTIKFNSTFVM
jgi:hypothetical protein